MQIYLARLCPEDYENISCVNTCTWVGIAPHNTYNLISFHSCYLVEYYRNILRAAPPISINVGIPTRGCGSRDVRSSFTKIQAPS